MDDTTLGILMVQRHDSTASIRAEHDQIWIGDYDVVAKKMSKTERKFMKEDLNWFEDAGSWSTFV